MGKKTHLLPQNPATEVMIVVEDAQVDQLLLKRILESWGYHVVCADNGVQGLEALDFCLKHRLNLTGIVSDILMPEMDGMEFLTRVKRRKSTKEVPFVFLTSATDNFYVSDAEKRGASGYVLKPISVFTLKAKLKEIFPFRE